MSGLPGFPSRLASYKHPDGMVCSWRHHCEGCRKAGRFAVITKDAAADVNRYVSSLARLPVQHDETLVRLRSKVMAAIVTRIAARIAAQRVRNDTPRRIVPSAYADWYRRER